jgi:murein DD-endopeptidase MepM/ murein hydrolase activator NlpD
MHSSSALHGKEGEVFDIHKTKNFFKKAFTPVTIMLIPHSNKKPLNLKVPSIGILVSIVLWFIGTIYVFSVAVNAFEYQAMKKKLNYYSSQFLELEGTMTALKNAEGEFKRLFSLGSKDKILENIDTSYSGSIDMENLRQEIDKTIKDVTEIKNYLNLQKDIYCATPKGTPVEGPISSQFGKRENPISGADEFHAGLDISTNSGNPITATADGIVSFSGWNGGSGNLVVLEHGFGFSTFYAHNRTNVVRVGQKVKRGDVIGYVGSTGNATGPHVHYEIWKNRNPVNPNDYRERRS